MLSLFDDQPEPEADKPEPVRMYDSQRAEIRSLFETLQIVTAREQFDFVEQLTGMRITSVADLDAQSANVLISRLRSRVSTSGVRSTGNSWDDRDEDTWIDRL